MRAIDMVYAFPGFLLVLTIAAVINSSSLWQIVFVLSLTGWATYARLVRGEILHLKEKEFVQGARALGAKPIRQLIFYIWPNLVGPITIQASFGMAVTIITESSLSFLGIGCVACGGSVLTPILGVVATNVSISFAESVSILLLLVAVVVSYISMNRVTFMVAKTVGRK